MDRASVFMSKEGVPMLSSRPLFSIWTPVMNFHLFQNPHFAALWSPGCAKQSSTFFLNRIYVIDAILLLVKRVTNPGWGWHFNYLFSLLKKPGLLPFALYCFLNLSLLFTPVALFTRHLNYSIVSCLIFLNVRLKMYTWRQKLKHLLNIIL